MDFAILDIIVIVLVTILGLKGLIQGVVKELFGLLGIVGGVFVASRFSGEAGSSITGLLPFIESESGGKLVGFAVVFVLFWMGMILLGNILKKMLKVSGLGIFDRVGGAAVGGAKIFLIFAIVAYAAGSIDFIAKKVEPKLADSMMYPILFETGSHIMKMDSNPAMDSVKELRKEMASEMGSLSSDIMSEVLKSSDTGSLSKDQMSELMEKVKELSPDQIEAMKQNSTELSKEQMETIKQLLNSGDRE